MKLLAIAFLLMISSATFANTTIMDANPKEHKNSYPALEDRFGSNTK